MAQSLARARRLAAAVGAVAGLAGASVGFGQSLTTTFAGGNGFAGNTFDLVPLWPITVTGWRTNINGPFGALSTIAIYTRPGTSAGFGGSAAGWSLLGRDAAVAGAGVGGPSPVAVSGLMLTPGQTTGVYWDLQNYVFSRSLEYTTGPSTTYSNADLTIRSQAGHGTPAFSSVTLDRIWNGRVDYRPTASSAVNVAETVGGSADFGVTFDVMPSRDVLVLGVGTSLSAATAGVPVSVYWRTGTAVGNEGSAAGWTLLVTDPSVAGSAGNVVSMVNGPTLTLRRGQLYGFYVATPGPVNLSTTDGSGAFVGTDLQIVSGIGMGAGLFEATGTPRVFNGYVLTTTTAEPRRLLTSMSGVSAADGVMFDVQAGAAAVDVTGFDVNVAAAAGSSPVYRVYFRRGTSVGAENSADGWVEVSDRAVVASGSGRGTALQFGRVTIPARQRYGFFITGLDAAAADDVLLSNGTSSVTNTDITIFPNCAKTLPVFEGARQAGRVFNGRVQYVFSTCYANCDGSTTAPVLGAADFNCFLARYRAGNAYANCDLSATAPVFGAVDFRCFLDAYRAGCP